MNIGRVIMTIEFIIYEINLPFKDIVFWVLYIKHIF